MANVLAGILLVYSVTVITQSSRLPSVYKRLRLSRYPHRVNYLHTPLRLHENNQYFSYYENYPMRKTISSGDSVSKLPPKYDIKDSFEILFDKNGMLFLTLPKNDEDRILNNLMNDVIKYKAGVNEKALRTKKAKSKDSNFVVRTKNKMLNIQDDVVPPRNAFNFHDIVG
ncbi:hypothetical protein RR48_01331 [Papilio machaon]|uniref:Uncharacterized protein n=1 Tax=Papilio machaon TaxID=76193 RepID=A0A0N0PD07_PAPMA|nr:hypothetical protein RR48_01331 [Papilio machaon]